MSRLALFVVFASSLSAFAAPAPRPAKGDPPLTPETVAGIEAVGEINRPAWRIIRGPKVDELSILPWEGAIEVHDGKTLRSIRRIAADRALVHVAYSPDGKMAAWSDNRGTAVELTDLQTGKVRTIDAGGVQSGVVFSPDGRYVATGAYGTAATLWNVETGQKVRTFETDVPGGLTIAFSPDGKVLALGNRNSTTGLFEVETGKLLHILNRKMTHEIRFNPAGTILAAAYVDGGLSLWDVATGKVVREQASGAEELYSLDWNPRGNLLATSGLKGRIIVWDPSNLKPLKQLDGPPWVIRVRFSSDGSQLFTAGGSVGSSADRKVQVWGIPGAAR